MSVNLHLRLNVKGYNPSRIGAIQEAVQAIFEDEEIDSDMSLLQESKDGDTAKLVSQSDPAYPVIISSSYTWLPEVQAALLAAVNEANGSACEVQFEGDDADEGSEEVETYDDVDE